MFDTYKTMLIDRLSSLSTALRTMGLANESAAITTIIGKVNSWKDDKAWNTDNALGVQDADHTLLALTEAFQESVKSFEAEKNKLMKAKQDAEKKETSPESPKSPEAPNTADTAVEDAMAKVETALGNLF